MKRNWVTDVGRSDKKTDKSNMDSDRKLTYRVKLRFLSNCGKPKFVSGRLLVFIIAIYHRVSSPLTAS